MRLYAGAGSVEQAEQVETALVSRLDQQRLLENLDQHLGTEQARVLRFRLGLPILIWRSALKQIPI